MSKNLYIKTYGCQMNVYDSDKMADLLAPLGYGLSDDADTADMVVLNTCHIREKAYEKVLSELGRLRRRKEARKAEGADMRIAVAGCVAQAEGEAITRRAPWVDMVVGPGAYHRLPELVARVDSEARSITATEFPTEDKFDSLPEEHAPRGVSAFLSVQEGCDKFCSFCVVPYTRGAEFSRPAQSIINEAKRLVASGSSEITLLGQNVNAWHGEGMDGATWNFARLLHALAECDGLTRIRYTTSHPCDMDDALIAAHATIPQLMPHLHLPVQSGSDRILKAMNRRHSRDDYLRIIEKLRTARDDMALSSDFIIGFPGETSRDFADTISLIDRVQYASAYSFKYSPRPGTPAAVMEDRVAEDEADERLQSLQQLLAAQQRAFNEAKLGAQTEILVEGKSPKQDKARDDMPMHTGRTPWMQAVHFPAHTPPIGAIIPVRITAARQNSLMAEPL